MVNERAPTKTCFRRGILVSGLLAALSAAAPAAAQNALTLVSVSAYGNLHAAGVVATVSGDADFDGAAALAFRPATGGAFVPVQPLVRIAAGRFVGSLFRLTPGTAYEARVTVTDPDGVSGPAALTAAVSTRPDSFVEPTLRTLYVSALDGDDDDDGETPATAVATIQRAADLSQPGDRISIAPGIYRESVDVPTSGTAAQPIVFRGSAPGAILDGADAAIAQGLAIWIPNGSGVFRTTPGFDTGHVVSELGRLYRYGSVAELAALAAGDPGGFHFDGATLYVKFADSSLPALHTLHVARFEDGFVLDGRAHVRIENLEIRHFGAGDYGKGVYLRYASDCAVRFCRIHEVESAGVWVKGGDRHRIEGNDFWDSSIPDWPWELTKGSSAENNGVVLTDDVGRGHVVRGNRFRGLFNGVGPCGGSGAGGVATSEVDVYGNDFAAHNDDALEPEGFCANLRIWSNRIRDSHMAFAVAPAAPGPTWIVRNVAYDIGNTRTSQLDGHVSSGIKINSGYATPIGPLLVYHNTFYTTAPGTSALYLLNAAESTFLRSRNNVFASPAQALYKVNDIVLDLDHDDLFRSTAGNLVSWEGTPYASLGALFAGEGQEGSGVTVPPALANAAGNDFHPLAASGLRDQGIVLPGINDGLPDGQPDLGALEFDGGIFADGFEAGWPLWWSAVAP